MSSNPTTAVARESIDAQSAERMMIQADGERKEGTAQHTTAVAVG